MRSQTWLRAGLAAAVVCFAATAAFTQEQSQSSNQQQTGDALADAARKAQAAKKTAPKPKKVYTEDDISTRPATQPGTTASAAGSDASAPSSQAAQGTEGQAETSGDAKAETPEQKWRKRFQAQRDKIAQAEKELDILQREHEKSLLQYYPDPQKALTQQYNRQDINKLDTQIAAKTKEIASLKQQLSDMEDELRKEGGDPGWAR